MEAVYCDTMPLLPRRLTYPELFQANNNPKVFYDDQSDLLKKLTAAIQDISDVGMQNYKSIATNYDWSIMVKVYDEEFNKL